MSLKYYASASPIFFDKASEEFLSEFQNNINEQFYNAPNAYVIQEETILGSGSFVDVEVRIDHLVNSPTGQLLGDDYKLIIFKDLQHSSSIGTKYYFDNNYWITVNSEIYKNFAASATIRRANNMLKWVDENGVYYEEPCAIDNQISRPRDEVGASDPVMPAGYINVYCQLNTKTKKIRPNQRFLFGQPDNRVSFRVFGTGIRNFLNQETSNDSTARLLELSMGGNFENEDSDNLVLGIANYYRNFRNLTSGSNIGVLDIIVNPNVNYILESASRVFDVRYYSGSTILSGSFVFTVSGSAVPTDHYAFGQESNNTFSIYNIEKFTDSTLDILCSGSSGSRILELELRGRW